MKNFLRQQGGNVLVFTATSLFAILGIAAFSIDTGHLLTAKNQLQAAVDAAALAGSAGLMVSQAEAAERAIQYAAANDVIHQQVVLSQSNISFPSLTRIRVQASRPISLFFSGILGFNTTPISAAAAAEILTIVGTPGARPWAVPDMNYTIGAQAVIKAGELGDTGSNSFFYPVAYPPINRGDPVTGASAYEENIAFGSHSLVAIGDILLVEPGNKVGPTQQGVNALISQDPGAYWDGERIAGSLYPGFSSPRIAKVALFDPNFPPDNGRDRVTVVGLAAFFVNGTQGKDVIGYFIEMTASGVTGTGKSMLYSARLVD